MAILILYINLRIVVLNATLVGNSWHRGVIDESMGAGQYSVLYIDSNDVSHIAYYANNQMSLKYAFFRNDVWEISTVDILDNVGIYSSIEINSNSDIHINYYNAS